MGINNPDIRLVIKSHLLITIDAMIQRLEKVGRNDNQSIFILISPKQTNIKDLKEFKQSQIKTATQLSNNNQAKVYPLSCFINTNIISYMESVTKSETKSDNKDINATNQFSFLLTIEDKV